MSKSSKRVITESQLEMILHGLEKVFEESMKDVRDIRNVGDFHNLRHVLKRVKDSLRLTKELTKGRLKKDDIDVPHRSDPNSLAKKFEKSMKDESKRTGREYVLHGTDKEPWIEEVTPDESSPACGCGPNEECSKCPSPPPLDDEMDEPTHSCNEEGCDVCGCRTPGSGEDDESHHDTTTDLVEDTNSWEDEDPDFCEECMHVHTGSCDTFAKDEEEE